MHLSLMEDFPTIQLQEVGTTTTFVARATVNGNHMLAEPNNHGNDGVITECSGVVEDDIYPLTISSSDSMQAHAVCIDE